MSMCMFPHEVKYTVYVRVCLQKTKEMLDPLHSQALLCTPDEVFGNGTQVLCKYSKSFEPVSPFPAPALILKCIELVLYCYNSHNHRS